MSEVFLVWNVRPNEQRRVEAVFSTEELALAFANKLVDSELEWNPESTTRWWVEGWDVAQAV